MYHSSNNKYIRMITNNNSERTGRIRILKFCNTTTCMAYHTLHLVWDPGLPNFGVLSYIFHWWHFPDKLVRSWSSNYLWDNDWKDIKLKEKRWISSRLSLNTGIMSISSLLWAVCPCFLNFESESGFLVGTGCGCNFC